MTMTVDRKTVEVALTKGMVALVDEEEVEMLMEGGSWVASSKDTARTAFYAQRGNAYMHRLIIGAASGEHVDHINGDTLDNRKVNLRIATPKENAANSKRRSDNTTGFKGVKEQHNGTFLARVREGRLPASGSGRVSGYNIYSSVHTTAEEAARARDEAVRRLKDPAFEVYNFPLPGERGLNGEVV